MPANAVAATVLCALTLFIVFAPTWYRLYYRICQGKPYIEEDSGR